MPKAFTTYRMYPRGFYGADTGPVVEHTKTVENFTSGPDLSLLIPSRTGQPSPSKRVSDLYQAYIDHPNLYDKFAFREDVLQAAFEIFGTDEFDSWFRRQFTSPAISDLHSKYLDETLHYIETGERTTKNLMWARLLDGTAVSNKPERISDEAKAFFFHRDGSRKHDNASLEGVLRQWLSHPNGLDDLISTLMVLFGRY